MVIDKVTTSMNCLEKYRAKLIRDINRNLGILVTANEEEAVHDFRVGIKKLTALYRFLNQVDPELHAKRLLKPYRSLAKSIGGIRDCDIAVNIISGLEELGPQESRRLIGALRQMANRDYRLFQKRFREGRISVRMPTIRATGISAAAIARQKPELLNRWLVQVLAIGNRATAKQRHQQRILLKRYRHVLDAFAECPGHGVDESEIKQIRILEQLLGDWHDRVVTVELLRTLPNIEASIGPVIAILKRQEQALLGTSKIYLRKFALWHQKSRSET